MPSGQIDSETIPLHPGDTFVLFTDGVSEAFDINQELFGEERLLAHLASAPGVSARETTLGVLDAVRRHAAGAKQSDDITVLSVRYSGERCVADGSRQSSVVSRQSAVGNRVVVGPGEVYRQRSGRDRLLKGLLGSQPRPTMPPPLLVRLKARRRPSSRVSVRLPGPASTRASAMPVMSM